MSTLGCAQRRAVPADGLDDLLVEREPAPGSSAPGPGRRRSRGERAGRPRGPRARRRRWRPSPASPAARSGRCGCRRPPAGWRAPRRRSRRRRRRGARRCAARASSSAAALAALHATTSSLAPASSRWSAISIENVSSSGLRAVAVREPRGVAEVQVVLGRQRDEQLVQHGQAADAGVEHRHRARVAHRLASSVDGAQSRPGADTLAARCAR